MFSFNSPHGWCGMPRLRHVTIARAARGRTRRVRARSRDAGGTADRKPEEDISHPAPPATAACIDPARAVRVLGERLEEIVALSVADARAKLARFVIHRTPGRDRARHPCGDRAAAALHGAKSASATSSSTAAPTRLSGGEAQRIRLASPARLQPARRALRARRADHRPASARQRALLDTLHALRDKGNSLLVVEHDEETMRRAGHSSTSARAPAASAARSCSQATIRPPPKQTKTRRLDRQPTCASSTPPMTHPLRGERRPLPAAKATDDWLASKARPCTT